MLTPHPTLRRSDVFPQRANIFRALCGENDVLHLTYNARGALYQLLHALPEEKGHVVLLPAFHCTALVEPVAHSRFRPVFYRVRPDFSPDMDDLRSKLSSQVALIVVIHFFGFPTELGPILELRDQADCYVLEDSAHSFLSIDSGLFIGHRGDFSVFGYYKTVGSLFGGGLRINGRRLKFSPSRSKIPLRESFVITKRLTEQVIENSGDGLMKRVFHYLETRRVARKIAKAEDKPAALGFVDDPYLFRKDLAVARMPALCKSILKFSNWGDIASARRRNYALISGVLKESSELRKVFANLPENVCPWAYPVLLQDRSRFEHELRRRGVPLFTFGEVLHPLLNHCDPVARRDAEQLSRQLMMLPVHQNLSGEEVVRYCEELNRFFEGIQQASPLADSIAAAAQSANLRVPR